MARMRFKRRKNASVSYVISGVVTLGIALLVGNNILTSVGTTIGNITNTPFYTALSFLGMDNTGGTWAQNSIVGVLGLAAVASFVLAYVKVSFK